MGKRRDGARFKQQMRALDISAANGRTQVLDSMWKRIEPVEDTDAQPSPLAELSELLGVEVVGVRRLPGFRDGQLTDEGNWWSLTLAETPHAAVEVLTKQLRSPFWLNALAARWGRAPGAAQLVKADCRRALRLLHEAVEDSTTTHHTEGENDHD